MGKILYGLTLTLSIIAWVSAFGQQIDPLAVVCEVAPNVSNQAFSVPHGAIWEKETIRQKTVPEGFGAAVGWINAATELPCVTQKTTAQIEIQSMKLIKHDTATGNETVAKEVVFDGNDPGGAFERALFPRVPRWFGPVEGSQDQTIDQVKEGVFSIDLAQASRQVYHGWTAPRSPAEPNATYFFEVTAKITGAARLQMGVDYWRDPNAPYNGYDDHCNGTNNCEAWISGWYGDTEGQFVTFRAPRSL